MPFQSSSGQTGPEIAQQSYKDILSGQKGQKEDNAFKTGYFFILYKSSL